MKSIVKFALFFILSQVITHVMSFLCKSDREAASLVSKDWYESSLDPCLHTRTVIRLRASSATMTRLKGLAHRQSPHLNVSFVDGSAGSNWVMEEMGRHLGPHLRTLSLQGCDITEQMFMHMIQHCPNLRALDLSCCNALFMSGNFLKDVENKQIVSTTLGKLTVLKLNSLRYLSDVLFNRLMQCTPAVEELYLRGCNIAFEVEPRNKENMQAISLMTFSNIRAFLKGHASIIKVLDLSNTSVTSAALEELCSIPNLSLKGLILDRCVNLSDKGLVAVAKSDLPIKSLSFTQGDSITSVTIAALTENMTSLESLTFSGVRVLPDNITASIFSKLPNLSALSASCPTLKSNGMISGLRSIKHSSLTKLDLSGTSINDDAISTLAESRPNLLELNLQSCQSISDYSVILISKAFPELRVLNLAWCSSITDFGILGLDKYAEKFQPKDNPHYTDRFTRSHSQMGFFTAPKFKEQIQNVSEKELMEAVLSRDFDGLGELRKLESLNLSNCTHLTDLSFRQGAGFPRLRNLQLAFCRNLTDEGFDAIARKNTSLEVLNISHCHIITITGLKALVTSLQQLSHLNLTRCSNLDDKSLAIISNNCGRLKSLNLSMCQKMTVASVKKFRETMPTLQEVKLGHTGSYLAPLSQPEFF